MAEGLYLKDLKNLIEDTSEEDLLDIDMHSELIYWIDTMESQVYDNIARVNDSDLRQKNKFNII